MRSSHLRGRPRHEARRESLAIDKLSDDFKSFVRLNSYKKSLGRIASALRIARLCAGRISVEVMKSSGKGWILKKGFLCAAVNRDVPTGRFGLDYARVFKILGVV
jgi:hypothetical protein